MNALFAPLLGIFDSVLEPVVPDVNERKRMAYELATKSGDQTQDIMLKQIKVNVLDAKSKNCFRTPGARRLAGSVFWPWRTTSSSCRMPARTCPSSPWIVALSPRYGWACWAWVVCVQVRRSNVLPSNTEIG